MFETEMPVIDLTKLSTLLSEDDLTLALGAINLKTNRLRASKPTDGTSAYIWRMTAFYVSPKAEHQCLPIGAQIFYLPGDCRSQEYKDLQKRCDKIVDKITDCISIENWHGVHRWGKALGKLP